jgi:ribosomal protein S18 acetylase RimI-like enzyme
VARRARRARRRGGAAVGGDPGVTAIVVEEVTAVTAEVLEAMARLVPQLSRSAPVPTDDEVAEIVSSAATVLLAARDADGGGRIVGLLTLVLFRIPTGVRAWIEDVVVDESSRGRGVGEALGREAVRRAVAAGSRTVDLTSRPSREAANRLYRRLGFVERETNVYRYESG